MNRRVLKEDMDFVVNAPNIKWEEFKNQTVLITGANGFLPAYMVETLLYLNETYQLGIRILALVRNMEKARLRFCHHLENKALVFICQDVSEPLVIDEDINYIVHAASQASPKYYGADPVGTLKANVLGTYHMLELARLKKVKSFLFFSSNEIYGSVPVEQNPQNEETKGYLDPCAVRSCYAESKRMGENMCVSWNHQFGVKTKIVRIFHSFGPGISLDDGRVFGDFVKSVVDGKDIELNSDGSALRAFCYVSDATRAFFTILLKGDDGSAYNMGNPYNELTIKELAGMLIEMYPEKAMNLKMNVPRNQEGYIRSSLSRGLPDISKIQKLGWNPQISVQEAFKRTIESFYND